MKYLGSKRRLFKHIFPIMEQYLKPNDYVVDLFCGGGNFIDKVPTKYRRIANDKSDVVYALQYIRDNVDKLPRNNKEFTKEDYYKLKTYIPKNNEERGFEYFVSIAYSFGGKEWGGWAFDKIQRDYVKESFNSAVKQSKLLQDIQFYNLSYDKVPLPDKNNCIIYCDIPYKGTAKYKIDFDYDKFYKWVEDKTNEGYKIFISEYNMPDDFICIFKKEMSTPINKKSNNLKRIEKLFIHKNFKGDKPPIVI